MAIPELPPEGQSEPGSGGNAEHLPTDLTALDNDGLAAHICSFAARISAATCVFLLAIAEYDRRRAWERWECRSMVEWLSWRCRTSRVTAAHYCRTATALTTLPVIRQRFAAGSLSYSQVRALVKVATPANEAALVEWAAHMTANQLERVTATYHRCQAAAEEVGRERHRQRNLSWGYEEDGSVSGVFRLPPEQAAVLIQAIDQRVVPVDPSAPDAGDEARAADPLSARRADALVEMAGADLDRRADEDLDPGDRYLVTVLADEAVVDADGPGAEPARTIIEAEVVDPKGDSRSEARGGVTEVDPDSTPTSLRCHLLNGPGLAPSTVEQMLCDQPTVTIRTSHRGDVLDVGRRTRRLTRPLKRALAVRDQGCRFPGCTAKTVQIHHIQHWIRGGHTKLDNLVSLCSRHHHRHHEGGFEIQREPDGKLVFVLADGRRLDSVPPLPESPPGGGLPPAGPEYLESQWDGTSLTPWVLGAMLDHLQSLEPPKPDDDENPAGERTEESGET